jgi:hypothetical protein
LQEVEEEGVGIRKDHLEPGGLLGVVELEVVGQIGCFRPEVLLNERSFTGQPRTENMSSS